MLVLAEATVFGSQFVPVLEALGVMGLLAPATADDCSVRLQAESICIALLARVTFVLEGVLVELVANPVVRVR